MGSPHIASRVEDNVHAATAAVVRRRDWSQEVLPYVGYGSVDPALEGVDPYEPTRHPQTSTWSGTDATPKRRTPVGGRARVLARVVLSRAGQPDVPTSDPGGPIRRGISAFFSVPDPGVAVTVRLGDGVGHGAADRGGYVDVEVEGHNLLHGWHEATIECGELSVSAPVQIIGGHVRFGVISDIDDTVLITALPRPFIAAWNTFVVRETVRRAVPGMAAFYRSVLAGHEDAPMFYVSTGAWNTQPVLTRFLRRQGYPSGTLLLTDWGPTETKIFRSGRQHKRASLRRLAREFPNIRWLLVGDDGQHDPALYEEFALNYPEHVAAVAIRQLTPAQKVLSHGHPLQLDDLDHTDGRVPRVPWCEGPNGFVLHGRLGGVLRHA